MSFEPTRRSAVGMLAAASLLSAARLASAQGAYPDRPVTVIVPQGPGGANDTIARIVLQKMGTLLGQTFLVDNRPGAGGTIGTAFAAKARPDGYTLMLTADSGQVINPALYKNPGFDAVKDFAPIATVASAGYVLVANPAFPPSSVRELIGYVKAQPAGSVSYASPGNGTLNHLVAEMLKKAGGLDMTHVPYRSSAAAATDVVGGQVPLSVQSLPSVIGFIKAGKLKVLGVVNEKRISALPEVPTIGETLPGVAATPWYGLLAPAGTPRGVIDRLHEAVGKALAAKDVQEQLAAQGCEVLVGGPVEFAALIRADLPKWARIARESGARVD